MLLGVAAARGLFRGAAWMSGGKAFTQTADGVRAVAAGMAERLGVTALDRAALEQMQAKTILAAQEAVTAADPGGARDAEALAALLGRGITLPWAPWADGDVVTEEPMRAAASPRHRDLASGRRHRPRVQHGLDTGGLDHREHRGRRTGPGGRPGTAGRRLPRPGRIAAGRRGGTGGHRPHVPGSGPATGHGQGGGGRPGLRLRLPLGARAGPLAGLAFHCLDVPFFFDALGEPGVAEAAGPAPPRALAADMHGALVRFVTDGDPGWAPYGAGRRPVMVFAESSGVQEDPLEAELKAWT